MNPSSSFYKLLLVVKDKKQQKEFSSLIGHNFTFEFLSEPEDILSQLKEGTTPDMIIMNGKSDLQRNLSVVRDIRNRNDFSPVAILIYNASFSQKEKIEALEAGVLDVFDLSVKPEEVVTKISALLGFIARLKEHVTKTFAHKLVTTMSAPPRLPLGEQSSLSERLELSEKLSAREKKLVSLLLRGLEYKEISSELGVKYEACKKMIHRFYQKHELSGINDLFEKIEEFI